MRGTGQVQTGVGAARSEKNPTVATILSVVIVGLGQFYNGDWKKGLAMLIGVIILTVPTAGVAWLGIAIWSAIDAHNVAKGKGKMW
jgi:TM2 domain-containing membrane protein YozV